MARYTSVGGLPARTVTRDHKVVVQTEAGTGLVSLEDAVTAVGAVSSIIDDDSPVLVSGASAPQAIKDKLGEAISVKDFGAVGDGTTDDTAAFVAAYTFAASEGRALFLPSGTYNLSSLAVSLPINGSLCVFGDGMDRSKIKWAGAADLFARASTDPFADHIDFSDFSVIGQWETNNSDGGRYPFRIYKARFIRLERIGVDYSRNMSIALQSCYSVHVTGCRIRYGARDAINCGLCRYVSITDNEIESCDDDGIAVSTTATGLTPTPQSAVIAGNRITSAQGIAVYGYSRVAITGNVIDRPILHGIAVASDHSSNHSITVVGNTITNVLDRQGVDALSANAEYILITSPKTVGPLTVAPGDVDTTIPAVVDPIPYLEAIDGASTTVAKPGAYFIVVSGNTCARTINPTGNYSSLGYGLLFNRAGWLDPALTAQLLTNGWGITLRGSVRNALITGNVVAGMRTGSGFRISGSSTKLRNVRIANNIVSDCGAGFTSHTDITTYQDVQLIGNAFDLDPYLKHANRSTAGTWTSTTSPTGVLCNSTTGITIEGNTFKNAQRITDGSNVSINGNVIYADPAATGYSASNKGVGNCPAAGPQYWYVIENSDPTSSSFNTVSNFCARQTTAIPSTGKYVTGMFVADASTGTGLGWKRITTGTGHVLSTDWVAK